MALHVDVADRLDAYFKIKERGSDIASEIRGGVVTFLTMSYILFVNPQILATIGMPSEDVVVATCLGSAAGSLMMGLGGNLPLAMAPGMGLTAYMAYGLVAGGPRMGWGAALACCALAGLLLGVAAVTGLSNIIFAITPSCVKMATIVGMGLLISLIGMQSIGLVQSNEHTLVELGDVWRLEVLLSFLGLVLTGALSYHEVKGGCLLGMSVITAASWLLVGDAPTAIMQMPSLNFSPGYWSAVDFSSLQPGNIPEGMWAGTLSFVFIGLFDVSGVMFGLTRMAGLLDQEGRVPGALWGYCGASVGTMVAALTGCTPIIIHVESVAGIKDGARTGLCSCVTALLFLLAVFFAPLFGKVPACATAPVLVLVGCMMSREAKAIDWDELTTALPAFLTMVMMPFTFSISNGIMFGLGSSLALYIATGQWMSSSSSSSTNGEDETGGLLDKRSSSSSSAQGGLKRVTSETLGEEVARQLASPSHGVVERVPSLIVAKGEVQRMREQQQQQQQQQQQRSPGSYQSVDSDDISV